MVNTCNLGDISVFVLFNGDGPRATVEGVFSSLRLAQSFWKKKNYQNDFKWTDNRFHKGQWDATMVSFFPFNDTLVCGSIRQLTTNPTPPAPPEWAEKAINQKRSRLKALDAAARQRVGGGK